MVWGLKTSVNTDVSAHANGNRTVRLCGATALGILFVFCAPGQISKKSFQSSVKLADHKPIHTQPVSLATSQLRAVSTPDLDEVPVKKQVKPTTKSEVVSIKRANNEQKPVQLASLDLTIPEINKPEIFVPNQPVRPKISPPVTSARPELKLKRKLFGSVELKFEDERKIKAWSSVYERFQVDAQALKTCMTGPCTDPILANWSQELRPLRNLSKMQKITAINSLVNQKMYADDRRNYGRSDYWASPSEFLANGGDCEDYAILKFASLLALGVENQDMRLVVGRLSNGTPHAFLATNVGNEEYILDNRQTQIYLTANRKDYVPKYSMNLSYRWSHVMPGQTTT